MILVNDLKPGDIWELYVPVEKPYVEILRVTEGEVTYIEGRQGLYTQIGPPAVEKTLPVGTFRAVYPKLIGRKKVVQK